MAAQGAGGTASTTQHTGEVSKRTTGAVRIFGWGVLFCLLAFLINNYLNFWLHWPGAITPFLSREGATPALSWLQLAAYPIGIAIAVVLVRSTSTWTLREDSDRITRINAYIIRAAFFAVLYVGIADAVISFLRVEGLLPDQRHVYVGAPIGRAAKVKRHLLA